MWKIPENNPNLGFLNMEKSWKSYLGCIFGYSKSGGKTPRIHSTYKFRDFTLKWPFWRKIKKLKILEIHPSYDLRLFSQKPFLRREYAINNNDHFYNYDREKDQYPKTLLGNKEKRQVFWDEEDQEYFFDRHYYSFRQGFTHFYKLAAGTVLLK